MSGDIDDQPKLLLPPAFKVLGSKLPSLPDSPLDRGNVLLQSQQLVLTVLFRETLCLPTPWVGVQTQRFPDFRAIEDPGA